MHNYVELFMLGFLGSGHCLGMCGPLVLAFPAQVGKLRAHLMYHFGRITTYTIICSLISLVMTILFTGLENINVEIVSLQIKLSAVIGIILIFFALMRIGVINEPEILSASLSKLPLYSSLLALFQNKKNLLGMYSIGLLLGAIPCGLSYVAFTKSIAAQTLGDGFLYGLSFGLGTLPALLLLGTSLGRWIQKHQRVSDIIAGLIMLVMGMDFLFSFLTTF